MCNHFGSAVSKIRVRVIGNYVICPKCGVYRGSTLEQQTTFYQNRKTYDSYNQKLYSDLETIYRLKKLAESTVHHS